MTPRLDQLHETLAAAHDEVGKAILGQDHVIDVALIVILTRQHALIEGVPGVARPCSPARWRTCSAATSRAFSSLPT
jgi:hypothetical protein